jgi:hypothetical protein
VAVSDVVLIDCEPERAMYQIIIYGQLFSSAFDAYLEPESSSPRLSLAMRQERNTKITRLLSTIFSTATIGWSLGKVYVGKLERTLSWNGNKTYDILLCSVNGYMDLRYVLVGRKVARKTRTNQKSD